MQTTAGGSPASSALFDNYTKLPQRVPNAVWIALRVLAMALAVGEIVLLFVQPALGLQLFWTVVVPCLPALFAIAPGLWRQVCPMAFANQLPRLLGFGGTRALPNNLRYWSYVIGVGLLIVLVGSRVPLLNTAGWATGALCVTALALAFAGGLAFKGRSGWCGTFCPLAPVQRSHGQAPLVVVRNGYCPTCVGCQKNCFDFNPRAAIFGDLNDADPRHAAQRMLFMSLLPGLIVGYYTTGGLAESGLGVYALALAGCMLAASGLFFAARALFSATSYRMVTVFGVSALLLYYVFAGPVLVNSLAGLAGAVPPPWLVEASRLIAVPIVLGVWRASVLAERAYKALESADSGVRVDDSRLKRPGTAMQARPIHIVERRSGKSFAATGNQTLLEAMEAAGVPIEFGCRSGLCGADPVGIVGGHEYLDAPGADEQATLGRLGLNGRARLACSARACGPVTIDCDPHSVPPHVPTEPPPPPVDLAPAAGVKRVVIVGNGIAGITVAETLRRDSESLEISVIAEEPHHFYNRMALGRVVSKRHAMEGLFLVPEAWYKQQRITVWLNTVALAIDRQARTLRLGTGEVLPYDRLVLATGARAAPPGPGYGGFDNSFLLRTAADAHAIRAAVQQQGARTALVIGGGVLGVEAAESLHHLGLRVTLLHRGRWLMDRQLDAEGAKRLAGFLNNSGIGTLTEAKVAAFDSDTRLRGVRLEDGRVLAADVFVACAGVQPNVTLAREAGLALGRGVKVDSGMQTSDEAILAVGDVAEPQQTGAGTPAVTGLWPVAVEHGRVAAARIFGQGLRAAEPRIVLQLKSDAIDLRSFGDFENLPEGAELLTADPAGAAWWRLVVRDGQVLGAVVVGPPGTAQALAPLLKAGADVSGSLPALRLHQVTQTV